MKKISLKKDIKHKKFFYLSLAFLFLILCIFITLNSFQNSIDKVDSTKRTELPGPGSSCTTDVEWSANYEEGSSCPAAAVSCGQWYTAETQSEITGTTQKGNNTVNLMHCRNVCSREGKCLDKEGFDDTGFNSLTGIAKSGAVIPAYYAGKIACQAGGCSIVLNGAEMVISQLNSMTVGAGGAILSFSGILSGSGFALGGVVVAGEAVYNAAQKQLTLKNAVISSVVGPVAGTIIVGTNIVFPDAADFVMDSGSVILSETGDFITNKNVILSGIAVSSGLAIGSIILNEYGIVDVEGIAGDVGKASSQAAEAAADAVESAAQAYANAVRAYADAHITAGESAADAVESAARAYASALREYEEYKLDLVVSTYDNLEDIVGSAAEIYGSALEIYTDAHINALSSAASAVASTAGDAASAVASTAGNVASATGDVAQAGIDSVTSVFSLTSTPNGSQSGSSSGGFTTTGKVISLAGMISSDEANDSVNFTDVNITLSAEETSHAIITRALPTNSFSNYLPIQASDGSENYYYINNSIVRAGELDKGRYIFGSSSAIDLGEDNEYLALKDNDQFQLGIISGAAYLENRNSENSVPLAEIIKSGILKDNGYAFYSDNENINLFTPKLFEKSYSDSVPLEIKAYGLDQESGVSLMSLLEDSQGNDAKLIINDKKEISIISSSANVDSKGEVSSTITGNIVKSIKSFTGKVTGMITGDAISQNFDWNSIDGKWIGITDKR